MAVICRRSACSRARITTGSDIGRSKRSHTAATGTARPRHTVKFRHNLFDQALVLPQTTLNARLVNRMFSWCKVALCRHEIRGPIMFSRYSVGRIASVFAAMLIIAGCATTKAPPTRIDYDKKADFSVYRTFGFPKETGTDRGGYSTLVTSYFKSSISTAMEARGYKYSEDHPDLLVNFYMNTKDRTEIRPDARASVGYGYYGYRYGLYNAW